jgi:transposase
LTDIHQVGCDPGKDVQNGDHGAEEPKSPRPRRSFSDEFNAEVVKLVHQPGRTAGSVARELDLTETAVRAWVKRADIDDRWRNDGLTSAERTEMAQLRKELREAREERDI